MSMPSPFVDDAKEFKEDNPFESMMERFDDAAHRLDLDPNIYTILRWPSPDMNTNEQTMAWIMDTYSMHVRHTVTAVVTGKPVELGGSRGRREATGRGLLFVCNEACKKFNLAYANARVIIQGAGNVGGTAALLMHQEGYKVIGIGDITGALYNPQGLDVPGVLKYLKENKTVEDYREAEHLSNNELLEKECEILMPAATENVITGHNADRIKCRILAEGAH